MASVSAPLSLVPDSHSGDPVVRQLEADLRAITPPLGEDRIARVLAAFCAGLRLSS